MWDRKSDYIELGQWMKGRIYERRADMSPDGKYFIYFAMNGKWNSETRGSWTAISKAPWLKAIELHAKGDCWEGGGLFLDKNSYWLNDRYANPGNKLITSGLVKQSESYIPEGKFGAGDTGVYYRRLLRDGWSILRTEEFRMWNKTTIFSKALKNNWNLIKIAHEQVGSPEGKGCYWDEHMLENTVSGSQLICEDWEWAENDGHCIIWCSQGCLYRASLDDRQELGKIVLIKDFNQYKFENIEAPY
ncbi:hypothetical protein [Gynuella sunshinyii]|uniref:hypothetical protein n=1 Tax=Gynuella sunshinyii TaxID=1445505 RepID=UPI001B8045BA|nr:hypothetical protein [Gynuella sunshinyii]